MSTISNVNDHLSQFTGSEVLYKNPAILFKYTTGVQYLAQHFECYWLLTDISIFSRELRIIEQFQVWRLTRQTAGKSAFLLTCEDGNNRQLYQVAITYSDFRGDQVTVWLVRDVLLLPSEY